MTPEKNVADQQAEIKNKKRPHLLKLLLELTTVASILAVISIVISLHWIGPDRHYGNCNLSLPTPANNTSANTHFKEGLKYESRREYKRAQREFLEVLRIDPHFIGANLDLGYAYLAQKDWGNAEASFESERDSIECLQTVPARDFRNFGYMLESDTHPIIEFFTGGQKAKKYQKSLNSIGDASHYNLACLRIKQHDMEGAVREIKDAAKNCSIPPEQFENDEDLKPLLQQHPVAFSSWIQCPSNSR